MRSARALLLSLVLAFVSSAGAASAQEGAVPSREMPTYHEFRLEQLQYLSKRSRIGLISTSAAAAVGLALVVPALTRECVRIASSSSFDELRCSSLGSALLGAGMPILAAGATGMLVTAIMLGVRKGEIRSLEKQLAYERHRAIRWDPRRAAFTF